MRAELCLLRDYRVELERARQLRAFDLVRYYEKIVKELSTDPVPPRARPSHFHEAFCLRCRIEHAFPAHRGCVAAGVGPARRLAPLVASPPR